MFFIFLRFVFYFVFSRLCLWNWLLVFFFQSIFTTSVCALCIGHKSNIETDTMVLENGILEHSVDHFSFYRLFGNKLQDT